MSRCTKDLQKQGVAYPRTCAECGLGPCKRYPPTLHQVETLKEWAVELWVVLKDGKPFDYAFSRASAFHEAKEQRKARPAHFWSVAPVKGTLSIKVPA